MQINQSDQSINERSFMWQDTILLLTYKTHIDKETLLEHVKGKSQSQNQPVYWAIGHENGDEQCPYEHTHVGIKYEKRWQFKDCRRFDYEDIHCHIKLRDKSKKEAISKVWIATWRYICDNEKYPDCDKEPLTNWNLKMEKNFRDTVINIVNAENDVEACAMAGKLSNICGVMQIRGLAKKGIMITEKAIMKYENAKLKPWQEKLLGWVEKDFKLSDRNIYWIFEKVGCKGKTWFTKYMAINHHALVLKGSGRAADFNHMISKHLEQYGDPSVAIIDLPRTCADRDSVWTIIEGLLDGFIAATKYDSMIKLFGETPVVVFANYTPNINYLSYDRWRFFKLDNDLTEVPTKNIEDMREEDVMDG